MEDEGFSRDRYARERGLPTEQELHDQRIAAAERARIRQMALDEAAKYERYSEAADTGAEEYLYAELSDRFESFAALLEKP